MTHEEDKRALASADLNGGNKYIHAVGELVNDFVVSPNGKTLAFKQNYQAFLMPLMPGGQNVDVDKKSAALPVARVSGDGAEFINWSGDGRTVHWSLGPTLFSALTSEVFPTAPKAENASKFQAPKTGVSLSMSFPAAKPTATIALTGASIMTMSNDDGGIIDNGTVIISGDRIAAIGSADTIAIPAGAKIIEMAGKIIMPGFVDAHAHGAQAEDELIPQQNWSAIVNLAMGSTTMHDPSSRASEIFVASEMQRTR